MTTASTGVRRLDLPEALDASAAAELLDSLRAARGAPLELNGAGVRRLGGQGAQIMLAAAAAWRADAEPLTVTDASPNLLEALRLLGLSVERVSAGADA